MLKKLILCCFITVFAVTGCGGGDNPEAIAGKITDEYNELEATLKTVTDGETAKKAAPKIEGIISNIKALEAKGEKLSESLSPQERMELAQYFMQVSQAAMRVNQEMLRISQNWEARQALENVLNDMP